MSTATPRSCAADCDLQAKTKELEEQAKACMEQGKPDEAVGLLEACAAIQKVWCV